jgi:Trk K+ transport system NAD-binding subunit
MQNSDKSSCEAIYKINDDLFEMLEFTVRDDFKALNTKIKDIDFIDGSLIIAIMRGRSIIFPTGNDEIRENDIIVVIDTNDKIRDINDILR